MTERTTTTPMDVATTTRPAPASAGAMLRAARESAGLSQDAVALQLKLAPRQVVALEADDYARLPGRTFVRGFVRNYARLVHLDPERVVAALATRDAPALDSPALHPTNPNMGEVPAAARTRAGVGRWLIPLVLIAVIGAAAVYEFMRSRGDPGRAPAPAAVSVAPSTEEAKPPTPGPASTQLPNPMAPAPESAPKDAAAPAPEPAPATTGAPVAAAVTVLPGATEPAVDIAYRASAWTVVKDSTGRVLVSQMVEGGQTRSFTGTPPLEITIGNASEVSVMWRGAAIDMAPFTKANVARFILH